MGKLYLRDLKGSMCFVNKGNYKFTPMIVFYKKIEQTSNKSDDQTNEHKQPWGIIQSNHYLET